MIRPVSSVLRPDVLNIMFFKSSSYTFLVIWDRVSHSYKTTQHVAFHKFALILSSKTADQETEESKLNGSKIIPAPINWMIASVGQVL
jgi:hypothetical protein